MRRLCRSTSMSAISFSARRIRSAHTLPSHAARPAMTRAAPPAAVRMVAISSVVPMVPPGTARSGEWYAKAQQLAAAEGGRLFFFPEQRAAICGNYALGCEVAPVRGELHVRQPALACLVQQQAQGLGRIAAALLPWHHGVADVAQAVPGQGVALGMPAQVD